MERVFRSGYYPTMSNIEERDAPWNDDDNDDDDDYYDYYDD